MEENKVKNEEKNEERPSGAGAEKKAAGTMPEAEKKKGGRSIGRTALGIAIVFAGLCVCLYPFYRQKKSDDFNEEAINMILTPYPTQEGAVYPTQEGAVYPTKEGAVQPEQNAVQQPQDGAGQQADGTEPAGTAQPDEADGDGTPDVLGGDLLENPEAPDVQETDGQEEENANRLGGKTVIGVIQIPKIELIYAIVEGSDAAEIGVAIGHMSSTAELGATGNCALAGHRGGYSGPYFKNLDKLEIGDEVIITNAKQEVFTYKVTETMVVQPDEVWVIEDTGEGVAMLTLVTCENDGNERLIVRCVMEE